MTPIFLLSLPRSGSTLLQRKLMGHREIASTDEPWILLPLLLASQPGMIAGVHDQTVLSRALEDFCGGLPGQQGDWDAAVRDFATGLYSRATGPEKTYFLDKTPRYALVAEDLIRCFPDARFIILWRDPLSVVRSMNDTWGGGRWAAHRQEVDLYAGVDGLLRASDLLGDRCFRLKYEDLVEYPDTLLDSLFAWLGLEPGPLAAQENSPELSGRMGDPKRFGDHGKVRRRSPHWRDTALNPARRRWMRKYLNWLGPCRLEPMGYSHAEMLQGLSQAPLTLRGLPQDFLSILFAPLYAFFDYPIRKEKLRKALRGEKIFVLK